MSRSQPLTWANLPASIVRALPPEDRKFLPSMQPGSALAAPSEHRPPPDGWRARMAASPPKMPKGYHEHTLQVELVRWSATVPGLSLLFAVPNQGERSKATRGRMLAEGLKAGVPDLILPVPKSGFCGAALELKIYPNRPSPAQMAWLDSLEGVGWRCAVAYSLEQAKNFLACYLGSQEK